MKVHHHIVDFHSTGTVVTIGTFDGVHLGHNQVIGQINRLAADHQLESLIFTFHPHPRQVITGHDQSLRLINTLEEKKELLSETGIDHLVVYPFTHEFSKLAYETFVKQILIDQLKMKILVVGHDHRLGKDREGGYENLVKLSHQLDFKVEKIEVYLVDQTNISSSKIRRALEEGKIDVANRFLGRPYFLRGTVTNGNRLGRTIGFPTANILSPDPYKLIPFQGVYAVQVKVGDQRFDGMLNIGFRPTVNNNPDHRTIEVHLFDFDDDLYDQEITICFHGRIRDEMKFGSLDELKTQLQLDRLQVKAFLKGNLLCK